MGKVFRYLGFTVLAVLFSTAALASVSDDQVTSQKIKEADGTSGQNTNSGSGVKTGHIQDGAVTGTKIADGSVTDAKIAGPISASKISSTGLNADTVDGMHAADLASAVHGHAQSQVTGLEAALAAKADILHNHDSLYQQKYGKVAVVAQTGGDYTDPVAAMNGLATWCGTPAATNPCLVKIMPGVYNLGSAALQMQQNVDIEGAGEKTTMITSSSPGGAVVGAANAELRFLSVNGTGGLGIYSAGLSITNVTVAASGAGWNNGIKNISSPLTLSRVTITVDGGTSHAFGLYNEDSDVTILDSKIAVSAWQDAWPVGIYNYASNPAHRILLKMNSVQVTATGPSVSGSHTYAVYGAYADWKIMNSELTSSFAAINDGCGGGGPNLFTVQGSTISGRVYKCGGTLNIATSQLDGFISNGGTLRCFNNFDSDLNPVTCP